MNVKLLKEKNFSLLMMGKFISLTGTQMQDFALSLYVLKVTGSATLFASVMIVALIPQLILSPIAGVLADWFDRKKIIVYLDLISGLVVGAFAVVYLTTGKLSMLSIYALVILLTLVSVMYQPASGTVIPTIIKKEDLVDANGISSLIASMGNLLAPLIGGILFGFYGLFIILVINAISFIIAATGQMFINIPKANKMPEKINFKAFRDDFSEGIQFIKERKTLLHIIILAPILNFVFSPLFSIGSTFVTKKMLKITDFQFGLMQMIIVVSMMLSPFIASKYAKKYSIGKVLFFAVFTSSILIAVMAIVPSAFYLSLFSSNLVPYISITAISFLICAIITTSNIVLSAMFQKIVPISMMGRVGTVMNTCCMAIAPLGLALFGILFDNISASICILICACILFVTIVCFRKSLCNSEEKENTKTIAAQNLQVN
jgi:MFS family permease